MNAEARRWSLGSTLHQFAGMESIDIGLRLTLLNLLLRPIGNWTIRPVLLSLAAVGLLLPGQLRRPSLWFGLTFLTGLRVLLDWPLADNHAYLLCYWCLAISLALVAQDTRACLALNGRLLVGLAFLFATLWKLVLSPDYLDGRFFRITMLTDERFASFTQLVGGLSPELFYELRGFVEQHVDGLPSGISEAPPQPRRFLWIAHAATVWTLVLEGAVAIAFLWPVDRGISRLRDTCLLSFCATTYAVATVEGFGWLLVAMGVSQCPSSRRRTRFLYLVVFALILFYREVPWAELLLQQMSKDIG